jgi:hypothetical protein
MSELLRAFGRNHDNRADMSEFVAAEERAD